MCTPSGIQLTAIISPLEMVGAMLLMNREQVLWSGRGLGESSLGFFSSFLSSSAFSFGLSSVSFEENVTLTTISQTVCSTDIYFSPSPSSSSSSLSSSSLFSGLSEQLEFESESESDSLSEALASSSSLSPLCFLFLLGCESQGVAHSILSSFQSNKCALLK